VHVYEQHNNRFDTMPNTNTEQTQKHRHMTTAYTMLA